MAGICLIAPFPRGGFVYYYTLQCSTLYPNAVIGLSQCQAPQFQHCCLELGNGHEGLGFAWMVETLVDNWKTE